MKKLALIPAALLAVALAACGPADEPQTEPFPAPSVTYGPYLEDYHQTTIKAPARAQEVIIGQPNTMTLVDGTTLDFTIDAAARSLGADCASTIYDGPPDKQFIRIDFTIRTNETVPEDYASIFDSFLWKVRGDDGRVIDEAGMDDDAWYCFIDAERPPDKWETNSIYTATMPLPLQGEHGTVILEPSDHTSTDRFELRY
jgi:hypothetical protein